MSEHKVVCMCLLMALTPTSGNSQEETVITVPPMGTAVNLVVNTTSQPNRPNSVRARVRNEPTDIQASITEFDTAQSRAVVSLTVRAGTSALGVYTLDVYEIGGNVLGSRKLKLQWPALAAPTLRVRRAGDPPEAGVNGELILPTVQEGPTSYLLELQGQQDSPLLITDRIRSEDDNLTWSSAVPIGPVNGAPSTRAEFLITIDPIRPPSRSNMLMVLHNPLREAETPIALRVVSTAQPVINGWEPVAVTPGGPALITLRGSGFDRGVTVAASAPGPVPQWGVVSLEGQNTVKVQGTVPAGAQTLRLTLNNPNGQSSRAVDIPVQQGIGALTVDDSLARDSYFAGDPVRVVIDVRGDGANPLPRQADMGQYKVRVGEVEITPTMPRDGRFVLDFVYPPPSTGAVSATTIARTIQVHRAGLERPSWMKEDAIVFQLPPRITSNAYVAGGGGLVAGAEHVVEIAGAHFRPSSADVRVTGRGILKKPGTQVIRGGSVAFTLVVEPAAAGEISFDLLQDGRSYPAGRLQVVAPPTIGFLYLASEGTDRRVALGTGGRLKASGRDRIAAEASFPADFPMRAVVVSIKAFRDTVGNPEVMAPREATFTAGQDRRVDLFTADRGGLAPGQRVIVQAEVKGFPETRTEVLVDIERSRWTEYVGLSGGVIATRTELGRSSGGRNSTLNDVHFGLEWLVDSRGDLGIGIGPTVLGARDGSDSGTQLALSGSVRVRTLTFLLGRQARADKGEETGEQAVSAAERSKQPYYFMVGVTLGKDLATIADLTGLTKLLAR